MREQVMTSTARKAEAHGRWAAARHARGFTIVELIISISIISLLVGIMLPALAGARDAAKATVEMSAARDLMYAYHLAAESRGGWVIKGYPPRSRDGAPLAHDARGRPLAPPVSQRYPWRLLPYIDYNIEGLYKNPEIIDNINSNSTNPTYGISVSPTLGLNQSFMGGSAENDYGGIAFDPRAKSLGDDWYVKRLANAPRPSELLVFASAFSRVSPAGSWKVLPPNFLRRRWAPAPTLDHEQAFQVGHVAFRYSNKAVSAFLDGHAELLGWDDLQDMRHWAPKADRPDWVLTPQD